MKWIALLVLAACGSKPPPPTTPPPPVATAVLPDVPFDQLDPEQQVQFMKQKVVPAMKPMFQNHDGKKFAEFGCKTCHGKQVDDGHYDMPNAELPKLVFKEFKAGTSKFAKADVEWMAKEVKPTMAKLLQLPEFTPDRPNGFACNACHPTEE